MVLTRQNANSKRVKVLRSAAPCRAWFSDGEAGAARAPRRAVVEFQNVGKAPPACRAVPRLILKQRIKSRARDVPRLLFLCTKKLPPACRAAP